MAKKREIRVIIFFCASDSNYTFKILLVELFSCSAPCAIIIHNMSAAILNIFIILLFHNNRHGFGKLILLHYAKEVGNE
jgi:hypothetical protein